MILPFVTLVLAIVFVLNSWNSTGILNAPAPIDTADHAGQLTPELQQASSGNEMVPDIKVDTSKCFSWRTASISNVTELPDGSREWISTWVWHERSEDFCSPNSNQNYEWIDVTRLEAYANDEGKPRHTQFKLINGTILSVNDEFVVRYSSS